MKKRGQKKCIVPLKKFPVKRGDEVIVISGSERGKKGKVLQVLREKSKVIVEGIRMMKKAVRPTQENPQGGIIEKEAPISISNVMIFSRWEERQKKKKSASTTEA
ncbi:50S ribosomal protein L24 [Candidatus Methylacidiphilum fumarolicum]|uniref:Large ribosomal subunit protein uL24 n=2 Tax=Candidatus Methylacidiphilum fumarolicum TaxID=591154 RepID=I0K0D1_METFB|nr:50S ribosomal protein L24 [Candidatus Methylacidiphilum fumarolicum]CCG92950.1 50S ribosomal protein L24 [Methylacidiphilum fumariolicum SolV]TFE65591.1 50S ribosomal protein L24 [Candidatus Methylacidiphilum fumarolicum]TFE73693.1 50S ribosomal protein L24 [Candidatus Methylacidiphilum fumarolicum]TFE75376.1 50S ribosomal protein L24 [Candidatus Methylacidiphilum fumarolicum]